MLLRGAKHVIRFDANHDMDARPQWTPAGHVNHGCYPNCAIKKKRSGLWLTSIRQIEQGEELLIDYALIWAKNLSRADAGTLAVAG